MYNIDYDDNMVDELTPNEQTTKRIQLYKPLNINNAENFCDKSVWCLACKTHMVEPYIQCSECSCLLCCNCFCRGAEIVGHKNTHSYRIIRDDNIRVFQNSGWSAKEEKKLLDLLMVHGYGNWEAIAKTLVPRSATECRDHYLNYYFGGIFEKTLGLTNDPYLVDSVPYMYKMTCLDPPRYDIDNVNFKRMAGYRYARSDFDIPFDLSAEGFVSNLDLVDDDCDAETRQAYEAMNCAVFTAYNNRLK